MLELPESITISRQAGSLLVNKRITRVANATSPHKFAFFNGDPARYPGLLTGKQIISARGHGMFVDLMLEQDTCLTISDGTNMRYFSPDEAPPDKHQLLLALDDGGYIAFTVAMYGGIWAFEGVLDSKYHLGSLASPGDIKPCYRRTP